MQLNQKNFPPRSKSSDPARLLVPLLLLLANRRLDLGQPGAVRPAAGIRGFVDRSTTRRHVALHVNVRLDALLLSFGPPLPVALRPRVSRAPVDSRLESACSLYSRRI